MSMHLCSGSSCAGGGTGWIELVDSPRGIGVVEQARWLRADAVAAQAMAVTFQRESQRLRTEAAALRAAAATQCEEMGLRSDP